MIPTTLKKTNNLGNIYHSQIDTSKKIDLETYAISGVISLRPSSLTKKNQELDNSKLMRKLRELFNYHVEMIIEGVNKKGRFWQRLHFQGWQPPRNFEETLCSGGPPMISLSEKYYEDKELDLRRYRSNRQTWNISQKNIEDLLKIVHWEIGNFDKGILPFNLAGEKSIFSRDKNFYTLNEKEEDLPQELRELVEKDPNGEFKQHCQWVEERKEFSQWAKTSYGGVQVTYNTDLIPWSYPFIKIIQSMNCAKTTFLYNIYQQKNIIKKSVGNSVWNNWNSCTETLAGILDKNSAKTVKKITTFIGEMVSKLYQKEQPVEQRFDQLFSVLLQLFPTSFKIFALPVSVLGILGLSDWLRAYYFGHKYEKNEQTLNKLEQYMQKIIIQQKNCACFVRDHFGYLGIQMEEIPFEKFFFPPTTLYFPNQEEKTSSEPEENTLEHVQVVHDGKTPLERFQAKWGIDIEKSKTCYTISEK